mgnify:CR=1 FL=1
MTLRGGALHAQPWGNVDDGKIHKVDTVPPPAGESDAYNAPTRVGVISSDAWAELIEAGKTLKEKGIRNDFIVLVGGAPLNEQFANAIGADAYCRDAAVAVETAKALMARRQGSAQARAAAPA